LVHFVLLTSWLDPFVNLTTLIVNAINIPIHNLGWSLIIFALLVRVAFWPLNTAQFKTMIGMQKLGPKIKALQAKFKGEPQRMQQEQTKLFKEAGVNPLAGCLPMVVQLPIIFSVYYAVKNHIEPYQKTAWLWIGSGAAAAHPKILGTSLAASDMVLLVLYIITMYLSMRYTTMPSTDPAQAQTQKIMQLFSPAMLAYFGFRAQWPAAMVLYWISLNVFTMAQQLYLLRKYHQPLSALDSEHAITENVPAVPEPAKSASVTSNGSRSSRRRKRQRR